MTYKDVDLDTLKLLDFVFEYYQIYGENTYLWALSIEILSKYKIFSNTKHRIIDREYCKYMITREIRQSCPDRHDDKCNNCFYKIYPLILEGNNDL